MKNLNTGVEKQDLKCETIQCEITGIIGLADTPTPGEAVRQLSSFQSLGLNASPLYGYPPGPKAFLCSIGISQIFWKSYHCKAGFLKESQGKKAAHKTGSTINYEFCGIYVHMCAHMHSDK